MSRHQRFVFYGLVILVLVTAVVAAHALRQAEPVVSETRIDRAFEAAAVDPFDSLRTLTTDLSDIFDLAVDRPPVIDCVDNNDIYPHLAKTGFVLRSIGVNVVTGRITSLMRTGDGKRWMLVDAGPSDACIFAYGEDWSNIGVDQKTEKLLP